MVVKSLKPAAFIFSSYNLLTRAKNHSMITDKYEKIHNQHDNPDQ